MNQDRYEYLQSVGCVCCEINKEDDGGFYWPSVPTGDFMALEIHHLNAGGLHGGKRLGDDMTIPLCGWHHRGVCFQHWTKNNMTWCYGPSWAGGSKPFRAVYGSDAELLARANRKLEETT